MRCNHENCGGSEKVWLPYKYDDRERGLKPHLYCTQCGLIKNASLDKPHRMGFYINIISELSKEIKVTKVQMRLVAKELENRGIDDIYGIDRYNQEKIFIDTIKKYINVREQVVRKFL